jgi:hypothetical protein
MLEHVLGKVEVSGQIGDKLDEALKGAENEVQQRKGMQAGCQLSAKAVAGLLPHVDKAFDEGELDGLSALEMKGLLKKWLVRGMEATENLYKRAQAEEMVAAGKVAAMNLAVTITKRYHDSAAARARQLTAPDESETEAEAGERRRGRKHGEHPAGSPLDERREAAAEEAVDKALADAKETPKKPTKKTAPKKRRTVRPPKKAK